MRMCAGCNRVGSEFKSIVAEPGNKDSSKREKSRNLYMYFSKKIFFSKC